MQNNLSPYVVLLRGINVGGKNIVIMKELVKLLEANGFEKVRTYIQSGNIVLLYDENPEAKVLELMNSQFSLSLKVMALTKSKFEQAVAKNPYLHFEGKTVHFYFCKNASKPDMMKLAELASATENYELMDNVFYLHAPDGIGRSKLVANIEACLGVAVTGRNLNTINKLKGMINL